MVVEVVCHVECRVGRRRVENDGTYSHGSWFLACAGDLLTLMRCSVVPVMVVLAVVKVLMVQDKSCEDQQEQRWPEMV